MSFNIRVYGILIHNKKEVLVTDENHTGLSFTKFPGGGLEYGEGLLDCLKREFLEELRLSVDIIDLFYLTEHFQPSAFSDDEQVLSVYYSVKAPEHELLMLSNNVKSETGEIPRWISLDQLDESDFMFPIDKMVAKKILENYA